MKKFSVLLLAFVIAIAPVYHAFAFFPAIGSVVTSVVGAAVVDAGVTAAINVVAGKSPWGANDPVYGGQVKTPVKNVANWVKKHGGKVAFWSAAMALAGYFMDDTGNYVHSSVVGICSLGGSSSSKLSLSDCVSQAKLIYDQNYPSSSYTYLYTELSYNKPSFGYIGIYNYYEKKSSLTVGSSLSGFWKSADINSDVKPVSDSDFNNFIVDALPKIKPDSKPFTVPPSQYPSFPANDPVWPDKIEPVTPPAKPNKPFPTPVPTPQPSPTPDNPAFPTQPDKDKWPLPWPLPGLDPMPNPNPVPQPDPDTSTEIKPSPDGGFIIPNPLPVEVVNDVNVNVLNQLEQGLTASQLAQRDLRVDNDSAAGLGSPDALTNDSYFDAFKPIDNVLSNLPSPPSFNLTAGMFGIPSYSSCIPYSFTIASSSFMSLVIPAQTFTVGQHCDYYDANLRPFVAWIFQAIALLTIYRIAVRSTKF